MTDYEVQITEIVEPASDPTESTPIVRDVYWRGSAESDDVAKIKAWSAWDEKYGPRTQPIEAIVLVTEITRAR
jgi:hypothetical protein